MKTKTALVLIDVQRGLIDGFEDDWASVLKRRNCVDRPRAAGRYHGRHRAVV